MSVERIKNTLFTQYIKNIQRIAVKFTIFKPQLGHDHKMQVDVVLYPSMELFDMEEIHGLGDALDEDLAETTQSQEVWNSLVSMLDENLIQ